MTTDSMVEKMARAIARGDLGPDIPVDMDAHMRHVREHYHALARAALEAMREPTEGMVEAAIRLYRHGNTEQFNNIMRDTVREYFAAAIDAALKEGE